METINLHEKLKEIRHPTFGDAIADPRLDLKLAEVYGEDEFGIPQRTGVWVVQNYSGTKTYKIFRGKGAEKRAWRYYDKIEKSSKLIPSFSVGGVMSRKLYGWYCSKCDAIYFNPDADTEHEDLHESVTVEVEEW